MNKQGPGKIGWTDYTWNPIKGECPVACKIPGTNTVYCYGHAIYHRFNWLQEATVPEDGIIPGVINEAEMDAPRKLKKPSKIFVCSTYEIFFRKHHSWRDDIFATIEACPQHTFQILTKMPENIDRPMPDNVWLGVSITKNEDEWRADFLHHPDVLGGRPVASKIFVSLEPMMDDCHDLIYSLDDLDWLIIGRLTGHGKKHDPKREWIEFFVNEAKAAGVPIFLKDNLREIWGSDLIQEFPE